ncbi:MAG: membrane-associated protein [Spirochaetes bacterium]|nr:membrane-associated protein [Spirochaetota bacterium]
MLTPAYTLHYGRANFLWLSDIALFGTVLALWLDSALIASMMAVSALVLETAWIIDFLGHLLTRRTLLGLSDYMFDPQNPVFIRVLSLFHLVLPGLVLWMVWRLGYDSRAWLLQTLLTWIILLATYRFTDPAQNINWAFGPGSEPQHLLPPMVYLIVVMLVLPLLVYLPTHLALRYLLGRSSSFL